MNVYDFTVRAQDGSDVSLRDYEGKVLLIVNTATQCGFTPQYGPLQQLYAAYQKYGFEILDFPCNQFGSQAPGTDGEIHTFCTGRFGVTFPQFSKIEVNGENADPLFRYLTETAGFGGFEDSENGRMFGEFIKQTDPDYASNSKIKWNFTKFLIGRDGEVAARFEPIESFGVINGRIKELLK